MTSQRNGVLHKPLTDFPKTSILSLNDATPDLTRKTCCEPLLCWWVVINIIQHQEQS